MRIHEIKHSDQGNGVGWVESVLNEKQTTYWPQCDGDKRVDHSVKYIRTFGQYLNEYSVVKTGPLGCWMEWEAPTEYTTVDTPVIEEPTVIHNPIKPILTTCYGEFPHSTDPYLLSEDREVGHFFYSSCCQRKNANYKRGDLVISFYEKGNRQILTCVIVIGEVRVYLPADYAASLTDYPFPAIPEHFRQMTLEPLRKYYKDHDQQKMFRLCRGVHFDESKEGPYSFFPASTAINGSGPCYIDINQVRSATDSWKYLKNSVLKNDFKIGLDMKF